MHVMEIDFCVWAHISYRHSINTLAYICTYIFSWGDGMFKVQKVRHSMYPMLADSFPRIQLTLKNLGSFFLQLILSAPDF